jgi:hypothetical protein
MWGGNEKKMYLRVAMLLAIAAFGLAACSGGNQQSLGQ